MCFVCSVTHSQWSLVKSIGGLFPPHLVDRGRLGENLQLALAGGYLQPPAACDIIIIQ